MDEFTPESEEMFNNIGNPEVIAKFTGRTPIKLPREEPYKAKYERMVAKLSVLREHLLVLAEVSDGKMGIYARTEQYFKAQEMNVTISMCRNMVKSIDDMLSNKPLKIEIIDDTP